MSRYGKLLAICLLGLLSFSLSLAQAPPRNLHGRFHEGAVQLGWDHPEGDTQPDSYSIFRSTGFGNPFDSLAATTMTEYADHAVVLNTLYSYKVKAVYNDSTQSMPSNIVSVFTHAELILRPPPRELEANFNDNHVSLNWHSPASDTAPSSYKIYRAVSFNMPNLLGTSPDTAYEDTTVDLGKRYHYAVTAIYHGTDESLPSNIADVFTGNDSTHDSTFVRIRFTSEPRHFTLVNQLFQYDADVVTAPPDVPVCFRLEDAPDGMTIDNATGLIQWTPAHTGMFEVEIKAKPCDGREGRAEQEFHLLVLSGPPGSMVGTVRNNSGEGLPNIRIKLFDVARGEFIMRTETDDSGHYQFPFVNPTTYYVRARAENHLYAPQWYDGASRIENATPVLVPESTRVTVNFVLQAKDTVRDRFRISGTVLDGNSLPIRGARVFAYRIERDHDGDERFDDRCGPDEGEHGAFADSNGNYHLVLRGGTYIIGAFAEHYLPQYWDHHPSPLEADHLHLAGDTSGINFNLNARRTGTGSIAGVIRSAADSTGLKSHVLGFQKDSSGHFTGFVSATHTDSGGAYALNHLPSGSYIVLAKAEDDFVPTFYSSSGGTPFLDSATAVSVSGGAVTGIDIYVSPDSVEGLNSIAGHVGVGAPNSAIVPDAVVPLSGAIVTVCDLNHRAVGYGVSRSDGVYDASGLAPGTYTVTFQKPGQVPASVPVVISYQGNAPTTLIVDAQLSSGTGRLGAMSLRAQWNLISVPVDVADAHRTILFPGATSGAFRFDATGYKPSDVLDYASGYWIKFPSVQAINLDGTARTSQTIPVATGWNLIGSLSTPVPVSSLQMSQAGLIGHNVFAYSGGYSIASSIEPGKGYWVKATASGSITLTANAAAPKTMSLSSQLKELNTLTIRDAAGNTQALYFGSGSPDLKTLELPPIAPDGAFDVRYSSQRLVELHPAVVQQAAAFPILVRSAQSPVTINWSIRNAGVKYLLADAGSKALSLTGNGSVQLAAAEIGRIVLKVESAETPKQFALYQNFPNPFNPATTIGFDLPVASTVTLKVYNIIGQEVATVLNGAALDAGHQTFGFDATRLASGMYFYRLQAGTFSSVKKMVLVK